MLSYYMHRDSLTGLLDKTFAIKETERLGQDGDVAILVRLIGADTLPLYIAEESIKRTAKIISNITSGQVARIEYGDFVIFATNGESEADKIFDFLKEFKEDGFCHAVSARHVEKGTSFESLYNSLCAGITLAQLTDNKKAVY